MKKEVNRKCHHRARGGRERNVFSSLFTELYLFSFLFLTNYITSKKFVASDTNLISTD